MNIVYYVLFLSHLQQHRPEVQHCAFVDRPGLQVAIRQCTSNGGTAVARQLRAECFTLECG